MKARYFLFLTVSCLATLFISCSESLPYSEEANKNVWIDVYPSYISLDKDELSGNFDVYCSGRWSIASYDSWIKISKLHGNGNANVQFTVEGNNGSSTRYGYITISTDEGYRKYADIQIVQPPTVAFTIRSVEVRNVDNNSNVITDFGEYIYSYQTKYLQPKLNITVNFPGTYTVYTKLYRPDGTLSSGTSSPTGYSFSNTINLSSSTTWWILSGWGNNTAGHWAAGQYRWEFWYDGEKIGEKSFTVW